MQYANLYGLASVGTEQGNMSVSTFKVICVFQHLDLTVSIVNQVT